MPGACQVGGLFAGLSLVEHACAANACWVRAGREMLLVAARAVRRAEHITFSYRPDPFEVSHEAGPGRAGRRNN